MRAAALILVVGLVAATGATAQETTSTLPSPASSPQRPAALVPLYVSFASVQALDVTSTFAALDRGATEANPLMRPVLGSRVGTIALKAGVTGLAIFSVEKLWKRNRAVAIVTMIALNGGYAAIVAHNYKVGAGR